MQSLHDQMTVIGDGAMATVCALILASKGKEVRVWGRLAEDTGPVQRDRENKRYLPGVKLPENVTFTSDAGLALGGGAGLIVCAVPAQYIRGTFMMIREVVAAEAGDVAVVSVAKGIENETLLRPTQILREVIGNHGFVALSGPNIAGEVARRLPATMVAASEDAGLAKRVQEAFTTRTVRVYRNTDLIGVELAGALKNVVAVAAGILDGLRAGNNAKAALLTRGLVEITRLGLAMGAQAETFAGLAGLGDLVTTCVSPEGRNRTFGEKIGRGGKVEEVLKEMVGVVEGLPTTKSVVALARRHGVEMPISESLYQVLFEGKDPVAGIADLMAREPKAEAVGGV